MQGDPQQPRHGQELSHRQTLLERPVSLGLLTCAAVCTAHFLGTPWIDRAFLGLPIGLWLVGVIVGVTWRMERRSRGEGSEIAPSHSFGHAGLAGVTERIRNAARLNVGGVLRRMVSHPIYARDREEEPQRHETETARTRLGRAAHGDSTPRIGVGGPQDLVDAFIEQIRDEDVGGCRYEVLSSPVRDPEECAKRTLAGSIAFSNSGQASIVVPEIRGREAAWDDWSHRLALSYPAVFPPRVDPARISCGPVRTREPRETRLLARIAEAASRLAHSEARTGLERSAETAAENRERTEQAMELLARTFCADWSDEAERGIVSPACRAAARGVGAWLSMWDAKIDPQERRQWIGVCSSFIPDEPESHLRLAAAQIGAYEDDKALPALRRAFELLRGSGEIPLSDPLAFVLAEMEIGNFGSLALGRVAAGLAIAWATTPRESLAYLRDDLLDDLEHSGRLVGRDQDFTFLKRVMAHMDRLRSDTLPMRVKPAA